MIQINFYLQKLKCTKFLKKNCRYFESFSETGVFGYRKRIQEDYRGIDIIKYSIYHQYCHVIVCII